MSVELIAMLGVGVTILFAIGGTCGWSSHPMNSMVNRTEVTARCEARRQVQP